MKSKEKDQNQNQVMEGFNPNVYRSLSLLFIVLTILNLVVIVYAFARTGYGLWHAEDALSYIAKIDSNFEDINQSILKIQLHPDDEQLVANNVDNIVSYQKNITEHAEAFRQIDLSGIDKSLSGEFDDAMSQINRYYNTISANLTAVKNNKADPSILQNTDADTLRDDTTKAINLLFEKQDEATYQFFCRVGQSFLFVLLFLILTMASGLYAIARIKKRDHAFALKLQSSKEKTANIRQKAVEIAYTNVVTGLRNRYALDEELDKRLKREAVTVALYNFNNFKSLNEQYGRDFADEFVSAVSRIITDSFGNQAEIYSTDIDELCVLFNKDIPKNRASGIAQRILDALTQTVKIQDNPVQLTAAACFCHCGVNAYTSASKLFIAIDHGMNQAKSMCAEQNNSVLLPLQ